MNGPVARRSRSVARASRQRSIGCRVAALERRCRAEQPRVEEVHDRVQLGQAVLHRRAGQRDPVPGGQRADRARLLGVAGLDVLRFVERDSLPLDLRERLAIAGGQRIRGDHEVGPPCRSHELRGPSVAPGRDGPGRAGWARTAPPPAASCRPPTSGRSAESDPGACEVRAAHARPAVTPASGASSRAPCRPPGTPRGQGSTETTATPARAADRGGAPPRTRPASGPPRASARRWRSAARSASRCPRSRSSGNSITAGIQREALPQQLCGGRLAALLAAPRRTSTPPRRPRVAARSTARATSPAAASAPPARAAPTPTASRPRPRSATRTRTGRRG